jgi:hypothetical protein
MAKKKIGLGILVAVLVFGVAGTACGQSGSGTFTLTDIPSRFNGKYALLDAFNRNIDLIGAQSYNMSTETGTLARISNGRVTIPMWVIMDNDGLERYNGSHTVDVKIAVHESLSYDGNGDEIALIEFERVSFSNGNATRSFHDLIEFWE